jgi:hypothetical protein
MRTDLKCALLRGFALFLDEADLPELDEKISNELGRAYAAGEEDEVAAWFKERVDELYARADKAEERADQRRFERDTRPRVGKRSRTGEIF